MLVNEAVKFGVQSGEGGALCAGDMHNGDACQAQGQCVSNSILTSNRELAKPRP